MLVETKARVGVFAIALGAYLPQFPTLVPEFEGQYAAFKKTIPDTVEVIDGGIVTTKEQSMAAGDKFRAADVDLVILQLLTYATSYNMLPAVRDLDVPIVLVNVQKKKAPDYANTDTPTWLGELYACGAVGEMVADLERAGKRHAVITGVVEGGDPGVQAEIEDWCRAAQVRRRFRDTNLAQMCFCFSRCPAERLICPSKTREIKEKNKRFHRLKFFSFSFCRYSCCFPKSLPSLPGRAGQGIDGLVSSRKSKSSPGTFPNYCK